MRNFIHITNLNSDEITAVLDRADALRDAWRENRMPNSLSGKKVALWFYGHGFRNRLAFEIGARAMGADVCYIPGELGEAEPLEDVGHYLNNWFSILVLRARDHARMLNLSEELTIPLINARTNYNHPCEVMGDLQYIRRERKSLDNLKVLFLGDTTNLCMSWFEAAVRLPISVTQAAPQGYTCDGEMLSKMNKGAAGEISVTNDLDVALNAKPDVIYTDCWPRGGDPIAIRKAFEPFQVTSDVLNRMNPKGFFLPCPPVTRGEEVSPEALVSDLCKNYAAKEFLLHSQNAIMELALS
jgi:ornithine carbamoyltransferase